MKIKRGSWAMLGLLCMIFSVIGGLFAGWIKGAGDPTEAPDFQEKWRAYEDVHLRR
jgi:hypothetical protein